MGKTLIKLLLVAILLGSALYAFSQDYASTQTLPVKLNPETIFSPGDINYDLPFPSGVYYAYEVTHFTKDSVYTWEKEVTEPIEQAVAAIIVPCVHNDQFLINFRGTREYVVCEYQGVLNSPADDFHLWVYESENFGAGIIRISIAGGSIVLRGSDGTWKFDNLVTPKND